MILLGGAMLSSCTDMLDKEPLDSFTNSPTFWNNPSSVEGYAATFYNLFTGYGNGGNGDFYFSSFTDDQAKASFTEWIYTNVPTDDANWTSTYTEIRRANAMIEALNEMATEMDETTKNHWLGVARLMRGWQHWDLVRKYGNCVWVDHVPDTDDPILFAARDDRDMVMDKVLEDLDFACNNINEEGTDVITTWSRNMARALTADICLWEGTFRKYRTEAENGKGPDIEGANRFLNYCVTVCQPLMQSYSLCDNYQSIYNSTTLEGNPEIIFCKEYKQDILEHSTIDYICTSTQQDGMTKDAFDSYLLLDGTLPDGTDPNDVPLLKETLNLPLESGGYEQRLNIKHMLDIRDKRLAMTIDSVLCYTGAGWPRLLGGIAMTSSTGYSICKYDNVTIDPAYRQNTFSNFTWAPLYWVSVIYLNYAEAKAELGTITNDDLNNTINRLKNRAGLPPITTSVADLGDNDAGVSPLIWEIRRERRCELMFDNDYRYWDLIRWHMLDKLDTSTNPNITMGANIANDNGMYTGAKKDGNFIDAYNINGTSYTREFDARNYLYPIPSGEKKLNNNLGQNPGW